MKASAENFLTIIKGPKQFIIPIYQRTYSWQIEHCRKLFEDIINTNNSKSEPGHFIGSVVYFQEGIHTQADVPQLLLIDGQQRLTTITLLITAVAEFIRDNATVTDTSFTKLQNYYLLNSEEEGDLRFKLLLTRRDKQTLMDIVRGIPPGSDCSQRILENFSYFKGLIKSDNVNQVYAGLQRLIVVDVALEKGKDNPQLIFESMNSTGLDLSQADLIRNFILMGQEIELQTDLYERYWYPMEQSYGNDYTTTFDAFMRDFLSVRTGAIPTMSKVYEEFKIFAQGKNEPLNVSGLVSDIAKTSAYYVNMVLVKEPEEVLAKRFRSLLKLKVDVAYTFLLPVYDDYVLNLLTTEEFTEILSLVESYVFRRAICGIPTNSLNKTFATLYKSVKKDSYLEGVKAAFLLLDGYKRFPSDLEFETNLMSKDVYNFRLRNYLLGNLENNNRKELVNVEEYTIEHVMPQNPDMPEEWRAMLGENWSAVWEKYLHTLGNLTLTGYNSELSDFPFSKKKTIEGGFNDSPLRLNTYMRNATEWTSVNIEQRSSILANQAKDIWASPKIPNDVLAKYKPVLDKYSSVYTIADHSALKGNMLELYNAFQKRVLNIDSSVKEEFKKLYIAFKAVTNFVDVIPQKNRLKLSLNMPFNTIIDPHRICRDVAGLGKWGNGDVEADLSSIDGLDYIMELVQQAFDYQMETE